MPVEQIATKLTLKHKATFGILERLTSLDPDDGKARRYVHEAREALLQAASTKDYDRADGLLSNAEDAQDRCLRGAEEFAREAHEAIRRRGRTKVVTRAERGELSLTRLNYLQAAQHFKFAADIVDMQELDL